MKWRSGGRSADVEDRRASGGGFGGGGMPIPMGRLGGGGIGTIIVLVVIYLVLLKGGGGGGFDVPGPGSAFPQVPQSGAGAGSVPGSPDEEKQVDFVSFVLDDAQGFWKQEFRAAGKPYQRAKLVLFRGQTASGCGAASSATGRFYCPTGPAGLHRPRLLRRAQPALQGARRLRAGLRPGTSRSATTSSGSSASSSRSGSRASRTRATRTSSPCGSSSRPIASRVSGPARPTTAASSRAAIVQEGLTAASAVGDDRIQSQAQGRIDPESFTHGTSEQRAHWLQTGFDSGKLKSCDTFNEGDIG